MNSILLIALTGLIMLAMKPVQAQPPVLVSVDTFNICPGSLNVPVKVQNGANLGAISLRLKYDPGILTYVTVANMAPELSVGLYSINNAGSWIGFAWFSFIPVNLPNNTLFEIVFSFGAGVSSLVWDTTQPDYCQFADVTGAILPSHYKNGEVNSFGFTSVINSQPVDQTICLGSNASFSFTSQYDTICYWQVSTNGGASWSFLSNNAPYSGVNTHQLQITNPPAGYNGYMYRCLLVGLCPPNPYTNPVVLYVIQPPSVTPLTDDSICAGDTAFITSTAMNYDTLLWSTSGSGIFINNGTLTPLYVPSSADITAGEVNLILVAPGNAPCGQKSDTMKLIILPLPLADAGEDTTICEGGTATLTGTGGLNFYWNTGQTSASIQVSPLVASWYFVTVSSYGCSAADSVQVLITLKPTVDAGQGGSICEGETFQPTGQATNQSSVSWQTDGDGNFSNPFSFSPIYTPGPGDITTGYVTLKLMAFPHAPCTIPVEDSLLLIIYPLPPADAGPDDSVCIGSSITLMASGGVAYAWSNGQTTQTIVVSPVMLTTYIVTVTSNQGCVASDTVRVKVLPLPLANAGEDTIICSGNAATLHASGGVTYQWNIGATTPMVIVYPGGTTTYTVTVTDNNGCKSWDEVNVIVSSALNINLSPQSPVICNGESVVLTATSNHPCTFSWSPATGLSGTSGMAVSASPAITITYTATGKDAQGCEDTASTTVFVNQLPNVQVHPSVVTICEFESIDLTATGASTYLWDPPTGLSSNNLPQVSAAPLKTIVYVIKGTDLNGCFSYDTAIVRVNPMPSVYLPDSIFTCTGVPYMLNADTLLDSCTYLWQNGSGLYYQYVVEPGIYWVQVNRKGCHVWDSTVVKACSDIWVPNAFTPNADGLNDYFEIKTNGGLQSYEIFIYDRWGAVVFHSRNFDEFWDGRLDGEMCPPGIYHYVIEFFGAGNVLLEQESKRWGQVMLLR